MEVKNGYIQGFVRLPYTPFRPPEVAVIEIT